MQWVFSFNGFFFVINTINNYANKNFMNFPKPYAVLLFNDSERGIYPSPLHSHHSDFEKRTYCFRIFIENTIFLLSTLEKKIFPQHDILKKYILLPAVPPQYFNELVAFHRTLKFRWDVSLGFVPNCFS